MRIERLLIKNYRQFREIDFSFKKKLDTDLHIIIGKNGTGKTNVLNAINWCLYGDAPHHSKNSQQLPHLNLKSIEEVDDGKDLEIMVEVWVKTDEDKYVIFTRKEIYNVYKGEKQLPMRQNTKFEVKLTDDKGNTNILEDDEANSYVERFVPKRIRDFFFFDGERLDNYFKEATGQNIRHAIFEISQIDLLENRVESRLSDTLNDLRKEAGKQNPAIENTRRSLDTADSNRIEVQKQMQECNEQISIANDKIHEYGEKLRDVPDVEGLEGTREKLKINKKEKKNLLDGKRKEKEDFLFENGKIIILWPIIKKSMQIIAEKRKKGELPPTLDTGLLKNIVQNNSCSICGRSLDNDAKNRVKDLLKEIKLSSITAKQLEHMENPLQLFEDKLKKFNETLNKITQEINGYEYDLTDLEKKINQIDMQISGYDSEKIKGWHDERKKFEEIYSQNQRKIGVLEVREKQILLEIVELQKQLDDELKKEEKVKKLKNQIDFCTKALTVVKETKEIIMNETRNEIKEKTKKIFFDLLWKKTSFKDVIIEKDYSINLIHSMRGYECLGSVSAGERELLALSFTLALHDVSGFDAPILIDTPVARISDEHRENFGNIFSEVSKGKQTILLFTPAEYSKDISDILEKKASSRSIFRLSSDEKVTKVEVL